MRTFLAASIVAVVLSVPSVADAKRADDGIWRRQYEPCRKLTPAELNRLARGQQIEKY